MIKGGTNFRKTANKRHRKRKSPVKGGKSVDIDMVVDDTESSSVKETGPSRETVS